ncbi:MAG: hypothetical protein HXY34_07990 [Candidatus Thorarchaeota archaeon]|nr:hypothetical protein [Candidatus Thorarchaeota archaeon]
MTETTERKSPAISALASVSHDKDVDGLASAAIACRYAKKNGLPYAVSLTDYGSFGNAFSTVAGLRNTLIVVTDLGIDIESVGLVSEALRRAVAQGCRVVWLDHHRWPEKCLKVVLSLGNKPVLKMRHDLCAAEIAFRVLMPDDPVSESLARIAHDTDFNLRQIDAATALTDALSVIRFSAIERKEDVTQALRSLLDKLIDEGIAGLWNEQAGRFKDDLLERRVSNYRKEKLKKMRKALEGHRDMDIHGRLVRVVEIPLGVTTTDLGTFASDENNLRSIYQGLRAADLLVTLSPGGMLGFRRTRENVSCNEAAKLFKGGGHPYAAGGEYGLYEDFEAASADIFHVLSSSTDWVVKESTPTAVEVTPSHEQ